MKRITPWAFALLLAACSPPAGPPATPPPADAVAPAEDGTKLVVTADDNTLRFVRGSQTLLTFPSDGLQLGTVQSLSGEHNYDPYYLEPLVATDLYTTPIGLAWHPMTGIEIVDESPAMTTFRVAFGGAGYATLAVTTPASGRVRIQWTPAGDGDPVAFYRLRPEVNPTEGFYGLGEVFDEVNHRGHVRAMHFELSDLESGYNEAHVPVPLLIGTTGWGLFVPSPYPAVFAVAANQDDRVRATFGTGMSSAKGLTVHLFAAEHPLDITRHYYEVTGYPRLPAPWALGPWIWRDEVDGQVAVEADLAKIRELDLATTGYWIDRPYASAVMSFDFAPDAYDDPGAMIATAHDLGFRVALWQAPYIDDGDPATAELLAEGHDGGFFPDEMGTALNKWGPLPDLTEAEAYAWWQDLVRRYTDLGIEGFKLDYGEDIIVGVFGTRVPWSFGDGSTELEMQSRYQELYHRVYAETLPPSGGFLLCRAGTYGDQTNGVIIWPGDLEASLARHGEERSDGKDTWLSVGGLPASVVAGLSLGPSGYPFYGSDTGGYRHAPPDKETYVRWFEQTALSTVMQVGTNTNDLPWSWGPDKVEDPEILDWYRQYARLHLRLWPYVWTYAEGLAVHGRPIQRALGLAHPELGFHPSDIYLLGAHLLVAPVMTAGATSREVTYPPGWWTHWWTGETHEGNTAAQVAATLGELPLFARAGAPIPLLRDTIDTLAPVADPDAIDSYEADPGRLHVRVSPGPAQSFEVFDGTLLTQDGSGYGDPLADHRATTIDVLPGDVFTQGTVLEVFALGLGAELPTVWSGDNAVWPTPAGGAVEPDATSWTWSEDRGGSVTVYLPAGPQTVEIVGATLAGF